ncbi:TonB-dependent receptor [Alteromonas australica]|uniref:TonB-dependent receptor n=1 Tax=Alteromonas australica TaxID=589873 RepID=UPI002353EAB6|nr:TonB-dependent receptor [Alteromonas australica]
MAKKSLITLAILTTCASALAADNKELEQIEVVAQKRTTNLQKTPMAITALGAEALESSGINDLTGIETRVPGMSMGTFNLGQPQLYIRGIGSNADGAGADNSVVVFLDEVYIGRSAGAALDLYDIERVEVLRGPQGTLYGKNVVGGAISVYSAKPDEQFYTKGMATVGNFGALTLKAAVSGELADQLYGKLAVSTKERDGTVTSIHPSVYGEKMNDINSQSARYQMRYLPTSNVEINFAVDYSQDDVAGVGRTQSEGTTLYTMASIIEPRLLDDIHLTYADSIGYQKRDAYGLTNRIDYTLDDITITSITGARKTSFDMSDDFLNVDITFVGIDAVSYVDEEASQFSQELRFTSNYGSALEWISGLYYLYEKTDRIESSDVSYSFDPTTYQPLDDVLEIPDISEQYNETNSYAVFGEFSYELNERTDIAVGGRYTTETKDIQQIRSPQTILNEAYDVTADETFSAFTPRVVLNHQLNDDMFIYGSVSRGFKSGGFAGFASSAEAASTPFKKETATNYELGVKSQLLNNTLRLNIAAFMTDYKNLQVLEVVTINEFRSILLTTNAADATSQGVEVEYTYLPSFVENLRISGSYAYLDATYDKYEPDPSADGNYLRNAPKHSYNIILNYDMYLDNGAIVTANLENRYKGKSYQDPLNFETSAIPSYSLSNARLTYTSAEQSWWVSVWSDNIFDEDYLVHNSPFSLSRVNGVESGLAAPAMPGTPRTYGVTVGWDFY